MQTGVCATTVHKALKPHEPGQGSTHVCPKQALSNGQSAFIKHSGLHLGSNIAPDPKHESQTATCPSYMLHICDGPQGDGTQG